MTSAFGVGVSQQLASHELAGIRVKLTRAHRAAKSLEDRFARWRSATTLVTTASRVPDDERSVSVTVRSAKLFPHDSWSTALGELTHNARSALNQLNQLMFARFAEGDFDANRIEFPLTDNGKDWRSWRQGHRAAPEWLRERYEAIQPFRGPYTGLLGLRLLNDEDKHRELASIHVALVGSLGAGNITVEGLDRNVQPVLEPGDNFLSRDTKFVRVGTMTWPTRIIEFEAEMESNAEVELQFDIGGSFYSLREVAELPARAAAAVEFVAFNDTRALGRYKAPPA